MALNAEDCFVPVYRFRNPEIFFEKTIILYGAGNVGRDFYAQLAKYERIRIALWVDGQPGCHPYKYRTIRPVADIFSAEYDCILIAVLKKELSDEITQNLIALGAPQKKIIWYEPERIEIQRKPVPPKKVGRNIIRFQGGLGNQMFQYALYRALNVRGLPAEANLTVYENSWERRFELFKVFPQLRLDVDAANDFDAYQNPLNEHRFFQEKEDGVFDADAFKQKDASFNGYWQTEKYFSDIQDIIRKDFVFNDSAPFLRSLADELRRDENTVAVHVRRGDYFSSQDNAGLYGGICTPDYYAKAFAVMNAKLGVPRYVFFSDDLTWAKSNLTIPNAFFVSPVLFQNYKNWYDMFLMSRCRHNIIANSSFSWWGAWLNDNQNKIVVAPSKWLNGKATADIWCNGWEKV